MNSAPHRGATLQSARMTLIAAAQNGSAEALDFALVTYVVALYAASFPPSTVRALVETALVAGLPSERRAAERALRASAITGWMARVDRLLDELPTTTARRTDRPRASAGDAASPRADGPA